LDAREAAFSFENVAPEFVEFAVFGLLFCGRFYVGMLVDRVILTTLDRIE